MYRVALDAIEPDPPLVMGHFGHRPLGLTSLNPFAKSRKIAPTVAQKVGWFGWRSPVRPLPSSNPSAALVLDPAKFRFRGAGLFPFWLQRGGWGTAIWMDPRGAPGDPLIASGVYLRPDSR